MFYETGCTSEAKTRARFLFSRDVQKGTSIVLMSMTRLLYRLEWSILTLVALVLAIGHVAWHDPLSISLVVACAILPDVPLALFGYAKPWVFVLYNLTHSLAIWGAITTLAFILGWQWRWALLIWLVHISLDRAFGYALRDSQGNIHPAGD